ncbi:MAG: hypothetical protein CMD74_00695 [Gammaproteobacteria bacterium]|nr:hypothetical protein [Gammaproteobacteria bacterium]|tara:strand:+ start:99 stop:371 length:273 start_codon:yes stop_codon:yes gene_type:complete
MQITTNVVTELDGIKTDRTLTIEDAQRCRVTTNPRRTYGSVYFVDGLAKNDEVHIDIDSCTLVMNAEAFLDIIKDAVAKVNEVDSELLDA